jgi:hypothetical protein
MTSIPPELRLWRTGEKQGRHIYALLSNDPLRSSENDPLVGIMESSIVAQDVVSTHNGALAMFGRRYPQMLSKAEFEQATSEHEVYFRVNPGEKEQLLALTEWLNAGPFRPIPIVQKFLKVLTG